MNITERFRPKVVKDIIGNPKAIMRATECLSSKKPCILYGSAGIGKTTFVYAYANENHYRVVEKNASDERRKEEMSSFIRQTCANTFVPTIFLLDEVDGAEDFKQIELCVKSALNTIVLIANDIYKLPKTLQNLCEQIRFYEPSVSEVVNVIKKIEVITGRKANYTNVSHDVRNSILRAFYSGDKYESENDTEIVEDLFKNGKTSKLNDDHLIWLLDNGCENYKGRSLYEFYQMLATVESTGKFEALKIAGKSKGNVTYPRYIKRAKVLKGKTNE